MEDAVDLRERLETSMEAAVKAEDFSLAAKLRDELNAAREGDVLYMTHEKLRAAVEEERYEDAAALRDTIVALTSSPADTQPPPMIPTTPPRLPCESDVTTWGVNVRVMSQHVASRSDPERGRFFFAYCVRITNESDKIIQLRHRTWEVTDGNGCVDVVRGPGVIGQQPVLLPGQAFDYASACPLSTSSGVMRGVYTFVELVTEPQGEEVSEGGGGRVGDGGKRVADEGQSVMVIAEGVNSEFEVEVGAFGLDAELGAYRGRFKI